MKKILFVALLSVSGLLAGDSDSAGPVIGSEAISASPIPVRQGRGVWGASVASLVGANALDIHSSWGKRELNGLLAGPDGTFGTRGVAIKSGIMAGLLTAEGLVLRNRPSGKLYKIFSAANFAVSSVIAGTAIRNYGISRREVPTALR